MSNNPHIEANKRMWNERVSAHYESELYDVETFKKEKNKLRQQDIDEMGSVAGKSLVHLQCHFGMDTLSWAHLGAKVTGLDFSEEAIQAANRLKKEVGLEGRFVCSDLYDAVEALGETYDIVFTGVGAICWLPDIQKWAQIVADLLKPGGKFYIRESHPLLMSLADEKYEGKLVHGYPYFGTSPDEPIHCISPNSYAAMDQVFENQDEYSWNHSLSSVLNALLSAGLQLEFFNEHPYTDWQPFPDMIEVKKGMWQLAEGANWLPMMYSLRAKKPL